MKKDIDSMFGGGDRIPDLYSRRALHPKTGNLMSHAASRHCDLGDGPILHVTGEEFPQGGKFPPHIKPGQITRMEKIVRDEWAKEQKGKPSKVINKQDAGGALRITVKNEKIRNKRGRGIRQIRTGLYRFYGRLVFDCF